jgi:hypothetical protein
MTAADTEWENACSLQCTYRTLGLWGERYTEFLLCIMHVYMCAHM